MHWRSHPDPEQFIFFSCTVFLSLGFLFQYPPMLFWYFVKAQEGLVLRRYNFTRLGSWQLYWLRHWIFCSRLCFGTVYDSGTAIKLYPSHGLVFYLGGRCGFRCWNLNCSLLAIYHHCRCNGFEFCFLCGFEGN